MRRRSPLIITIPTEPVAQPILFEKPAEPRPPKEEKRKVKKKTLRVAIADKKKEAPVATEQASEAKKSTKKAEEELEEEVEESEEEDLLILSIDSVPVDAMSPTIGSFEFLEGTTVQSSTEGSMPSMEVSLNLSFSTLIKVNYEK